MSSTRDINAKRSSTPIFAFAAAASIGRLPATPWMRSGKGHNGMLRRAIMASLLWTGLVAPIRAQNPAATFEELRTNNKLKEGETIEVTEASGTKFKARIAELSPKISVMTATGARRDLTESQVREIRHRRPDKLWNGMLIGTGIGLGIGLAIGTGEACESGSCVADSMSFFSGIGMGAGTRWTLGSGNTKQCS
jgi:hypothetical protein